MITIQHVSRRHTEHINLNGIFIIAGLYRELYLYENIPSSYLPEPKR